MLEKYIKNSFSYYKYPLLLSALTLFVVLVIEINHPFYFLQDDNRVQRLPFYIHNIRALLGREFPFYNFHQYLGTPVTIQYAALYPINYIALCLSKLFMGNYFGTMEFIAIFHLVVAALGFYYLMRFLGLLEVSCLFGAVAWVFCGSVITVGNSWIETLGYAAYFPWILLFSIKLMYRFKVKTFLVLVILKVLDLLLGNPQLFAYTMTFELLTVTLLFFAYKKSGINPMDHHSAIIDPTPSTSPLKFLSSLSASYFFVVIVALPVILQAVHQTGVSAGRKQLLSWDQYAANSFNLGYWFNGLITPFKVVDIKTQFELHFISHIGYLTLVFVLLSIVSLKNSVRGKHVLVFGVLAVLSLLWTNDVVVTKIIYHVPIYNRFRFPFRLAIFTSFYLIVMSTFGFDVFYNWLQSFKKMSRTVVAIALAILLIIHVSNFLILHAILPQNMFSRHFDAVPFNEPLREKFTDGRIVSAGLDDVWDGEKIIPGFSAPLLGFDYATLWGVFHFGGYDTMVSDKTQEATLGIKDNSVYNLPANEHFRVPSDTLEHFRKWGVKWYVVDRAIPLSDNDTFKLFHSDQYRNVLMDQQAKPLIYWLDGHQDAGNIHYKIKTNSIEIDYRSETGGTVIVNVLRHPFFFAELDNNSLSITETADNQMALSVPKGRHTILLKYSDRDFILGLVLSMTFVFMIAVSILYKKIK